MNTAQRRKWKLAMPKWKVAGYGQHHPRERWAEMSAVARPVGVSSRIVPAEGTRHPWVTGDVTVDLPVIVDWVAIEQSTGEETVRIEARVDLVNGTPEIMQMSLSAQAGLDLATLQREFRWASPLEVVTGLLPQLIAAGADPFAVELPLSGFPAVASQPVRRRGVLSDEFLTTIAREYLVRGRGYAQSMAKDYFVTPRTVVSWVEKARARGLLSNPPTRGAVGGDLIANLPDSAIAET